MQLGYDASQRRIWTAETDLTSAIGESIAHDKDLTKKLLRAASPHDAWAAAQEIGMPVVLKPQDGKQGKGATVNITTRTQVEMAYRAAAEHGEVLVERFYRAATFVCWWWATRCSRCANWSISSTRTRGAVRGMPPR